MNTHEHPEDSTPERLLLQEGVSRLFDEEMPAANLATLREALADEPEAQRFQHHLEQTKGLFAQQAADIPVPAVEETLFFLKSEIAADGSAEKRRAAATGPAGTAAPAGKKIAFPIGAGLAAAAAIAALLAILFLPHFGSGSGPAGDGGDILAAVTPEVENVETDLNAVISIFSVETEDEEFVPVIWIGEMEEEVEL